MIKMFTSILVTALILVLHGCQSAASSATAAPPAKDAPALWLLGMDGAPDTGSSLVLSETTWLAVAADGEQIVRFTVPLPPGSQIASLEINGVSGDEPGEVLRGFFGTADGGFAQIGTTQVSTPGGGSTIGWDFSAAPYTMIAAPHVVAVGLGPVSAPGEVRLMSIRIVQP